MITSIIIAIVFAFGALVCYAAIAVGARAEERERQKWEDYKNELYGQSNKNRD